MPPCRYRKPEFVEAMRWDGTSIEAAEIVAWVEAEGGVARYHEEDLGQGEARPFEMTHIALVTTEGMARCQPGHWVVRGADGKFSTCQPAVFDATYDGRPLGR